MDEISAAIQQRGAQWIAGETEVSKLPPEERQMRLGAREPRFTGAEPMLTPALPSAAIPSSLDWRHYNGRSYVSPVRNQGNCGSCWAFATTACLESYTAIWTGWSPNFSEQVLISCSGAGSCDGGYITDAATFIRNTGLPPESCYPYAVSNGNCGKACSNWQSDATRIDGWSYVTQTASSIKAALNLYGPLVIQMHTFTDLFYYRGGVYTATWGLYEGDHAVLVVGYDDAKQCFIIKNSWGGGWGESGFFRIAYSEVNGYTELGLLTLAYYRNPHLAVSPYTLETYCRVGENAVSRSFRVWNSGGGTLNYAISANQPWLTLSAINGSSGTGQVNTVIVTFNTSVMTKGSYSANIAVSGAGSTQNIPVYLRLIEPGPPIPWDLLLMEE